MKEISYLKGDVRDPIISGNKIIVHCCNDVGAFGAGVALAIKQRWPVVCDNYKKWSKGQLDYKPFKLGQVQFVKVEKDIVIANMIGQRDIKTHHGTPPIRYNAIEECLKKVAELALKYKATVHGPRFGAGLAGGSWDEIEQLIINNLCEKDIDVYIYDLE